MDWAWEAEYLAKLSTFIPGIDAVAIHWKSETLFRRWFPGLRSKYVLDKLVIPKAVSEETALIILSDELYRVPTKIRALAVFKQYVSNKDTISVPFPLGVRRGFPCLLFDNSHAPLKLERGCVCALGPGAGPCYAAASLKPPRKQCSLSRVRWRPISKQNRDKHDG